MYTLHKKTELLPLHAKRVESILWLTVTRGVYRYLQSMTRSMSIIG